MSEYQQKFDNTQMKTFKGEVVALDERALDGEGQGRIITLRTEDGERVNVHLAPNWFLDNQRLRVNEGDRIEIRAAQARGEDYYMAISITKNGETLRLRDNMGNPYWTCAPAGMAGMMDENGMMPRSREARMRSRELWGRDGLYGPNFDPKDVRTYEGEIVSIRYFEPRRGMAAGRMETRPRAERQQQQQEMEQRQQQREERSSRMAARPAQAPSLDHGMVVTLQTEDQDRLDIHLGPAWFMNNIDLELREGERITVEGAPATYDGQEIVVASRVMTDEYTVQLRDDEGYPYWAARQRMGRGRR